MIRKVKNEDKNLQLFLSFIENKFYIRRKLILNLILILLNYFTLVLMRLILKLKIKMKLQSFRFFIPAHKESRNC